MRLTKMAFSIFLSFALASVASAQTAPPISSVGEIVKGYADVENCVPVRPDKFSQNEQATTVNFAFLVGADGVMQSAKVTKSSGYKGLDRAALVAFTKCKFHPQLANGKPEISWIMLSYRWEPVSTGESLNSEVFLQLVDVTQFISNYKKTAAVEAKIFAARNQGSDREFANVMGKLASSDLQDIRPCVSRAFSNSSLSLTEATELVQLFQTPIGVKVINLSQQMMIDDIQRGVHQPFDVQSLTQSDREELAQFFLKPAFVNYSHVITGQNFQADFRKCIKTSLTFKESVTQ